jgi:hypothetical protein
VKSKPGPLGPDSLLSETKGLARFSGRLADLNGEKEKEIEEIKQIESLEWLNLKEKRYFSSLKRPMKRFPSGTW